MLLLEQLGFYISPITCTSSFIFYYTTNEKQQKSIDNVSHVVAEAWRTKLSRGKCPNLMIQFIGGLVMKCIKNQCFFPANIFTWV